MPSPELAENVVVAGRFRLNRLLGRGGMGSVWHATHLGLDTPCAIKFIEGDLSILPEMVRRFEREAKAAASLRSPHVVQVIDHAIWEGIPFIAMELLDGEDLRHRLDREKRLSGQETVDILAQVGRALARAHSLGIVHRDLKPDNIFITKDDDREIVKVLDFGIAKQTATTRATLSKTKTGALLGTPYYMSPEQAEGLSSVDARSDLWSMAVIAFECIVGRVPFEGEAFGDLLLKIMVKPLPVPTALAPVSPKLDAWWAKAASRDPNARFQTVQELLSGLADAVGAEIPAGSSRVVVPMSDIGTDETLPEQVKSPTNVGIARTFSDAPSKAEARGKSRLAMGVAILVIGGGLVALATRSSPPPVAVSAGVQLPAASVAPPPAVSAAQVVPVVSAAVSTAPDASAAPSAVLAPTRPMSKPASRPKPVPSNAAAGAIDQGF